MVVPRCAISSYSSVSFAAEINGTITCKRSTDYHIN